MGLDNKNKLTKTALGHFPAQKAEKGIIMKNLELQKKAELLEALVNDLCEETSAEETYERLLTLGTDIGITDEDLKDWGFDPFEDEEDDDVPDWRVSEGEYEITDDGGIILGKEAAFNFKIGDYKRIEFLDDFGDTERIGTYRVIDKSNDKVFCEFIS